MKALFVAVCLFFPASSLPRASVDVLPGLHELLRNRIEAGKLHGGVNARDRTMHAQSALSRFYEGRTYEPAWVDGKGPLPRAHAMLGLIEQAAAQGLRPTDYHLEAVAVLLKRATSAPGDSRADLVDLDLLLSDAFLLYAAHLDAGRVNPETIRASFHARRASRDVAGMLQAAVESGGLEAALTSLAPPFAGYARLKAALARYRQMAQDGGWPVVPAGPKLEKGVRDDRIVALRGRLRIAGDLPVTESSDEGLFDDGVAQAVRGFQERHGLEADGVVGAATLAALNVPVEKRVRQIELNLERWRWLPGDLGKRYILVNTAAFALEVVENGELVMTMRVVVGKPYRHTPVFSGSMTYLVLNPYWQIPPSIAVKDKLPLIRKDPDYLEREKIRVLRDWGASAKELDPSTIDWSAVGGGRFPFRLRQDPGAKNALGRVKFMFPNRFNVYLHDTPSRELFARTERTFSSGCIRIEKPLDLAEYLLRGDPRYTRENLTAAMSKDIEQTVPLPTPVPVHLLYWTAWVERDGIVHFRRDIYDRDRRLDAVL